MRDTKAPPHGAPADDSDESFAIPHPPPEFAVARLASAVSLENSIVAKSFLKPAAPFTVLPGEDAPFSGVDQCLSIASTAAFLCAC